MKKNTPTKNPGVKERLLKYIDYKRISKRGFGKTIGVSHTFLNSGSGIGTDNLETIVSCYSDLSLDWLITGQGPMLRSVEGAGGKGVKAFEELQTDQSIMADQNQKTPARLSYNPCKEKDLIIEGLKNQLVEHKQSHERIMEEKDGVIHNLASRLADKDEMISMKDKQLEDLKSNFAQIVAGRDKQIEDLKNNMERLISEKSEVVKMKDEMLSMKEEAIKGREAMLAMKDEMLEMQAGKIAELEDFKKMQEDQTSKQKRA